MNKILYLFAAIVLVVIGFCINAIFFGGSNSAFIGALVGALIPVVVAPWYKDWYSRRKEINHIKRRLRQYLSNIGTPFEFHFAYGTSTSKDGKKTYSLSLVAADLESSLSDYRFDKSVMLKENDYRKILKYCYQQDISYFGLKQQNEVFTKLFFADKYDFD